MARTSGYIRLGVTCLSLAIVGTALLTHSRAATYATSREAEIGSLSGRAKTVGVSDASGGNAVLFGATPVMQNNIGSVDNAVTSLMNAYGIPGMSIAITRQDKLVYAKSYGTNGGTDGTALTNVARFRLASVSKPITSVGIYKLIEAGKLSLDTPVFGPNGILGPAYPSAPAVDNTITIRTLLTHTTGVWGNSANDPVFQHPEYTTPQLINWTLATYPADHNRGAFAYSNFGYILLGRVIENLTGQTYEQYIKSAVLAPMGITDMTIGGNTLADRQANEVQYVGQTGADPYSGADLKRMDANGGWIATATDLARFLVHVDGFSGVADSLQPSTIAAMVAPTSGNANYASGWMVNSENNWWHDGALSGTATEIIRGANGFNMVMFCNSRSYDPNFSGALDGMLWPTVTNSSTPWQNIDQF